MTAPLNASSSVVGTLPAPFIEENCTIEHNGRKFTSGGAWLCHCTDGIMRGVVYIQKDTPDRMGGNVTTWHGDKIAHAFYGPTYRGNFCRMQSVSFELDIHGQRVKFTGRYCPDWSQACKVRSTKKVPLQSNDIIVNHA